MSGDTPTFCIRRTNRGKRFFAGVDGGGTATRACVTDLSGKVLGRGSGGPSNIHYGGTGQMAESVKTALSMALAEAGLDLSGLDRVCAALAGAGRPDDRRDIQEALGPLVRGVPLSVVEDTRAALVAAHRGGNGLVLIAGTGSNCVGVRDGVYASAGGWGALLGDEGSAYRIAIQGLRAAIKRHEKRAAPDLGTRFSPDWPASDELLGRFLAALGLREPGRLIRVVGGMDRAEISRLSAVVFEANVRGDPTARAVLDEETRDLALMAASVAGKLGLMNPDMSLIGGCFKNAPYVEMLKGHLETMMGVVSLVEPALTPCEGAAMLAIEYSEGRHNDGTRNREN